MPGRAVLVSRRPALAPPWARRRSSRCANPARDAAEEVLVSETVKAGEVRAERMTPKELGVRLFKQPPASFDPITAEPRELLAYGYPARPDAQLHPELRAQWERRVSRKYTRIQPEFVRNVGKTHGPVRRTHAAA